MPTSLFIALLLIFWSKDMSDEEAKKVIVVDLQMPFFSIVTLMVKWALASIPAIIILAVIFSVVSGLMGGLLFPRF
ncbi:hypothetical protein A1356_19775 [Methylomonas koyamae]|uniref:Uncharacterized protein n=2 Tax=Methylomonas koyamae TaxID=702114 RepID=A0AA91D953_9GAMM|nr:hypothetical protein A1356_19775 [Methylomonas koyamae]